jgi:hypothetical protein
LLDSSCKGYTPELTNKKWTTDIPRFHRRVEGNLQSLLFPQNENSNQHRGRSRDRWGYRKSSWVGRTGSFRRMSGSDRNSWRTDGNYWSLYKTLPKYS